MAFGSARGPVRCLSGLFPPTSFAGVVPQASRPTTKARRITMRKLSSLSSASAIVYIRADPFCLHEIAAAGERAFRALEHAPEAGEPRCVDEGMAPF